MRVSSNGRKFIYGQEGCPLTAYLDSVRVPTIGPGLTNHDKVVTQMIGKIVPGKTKLTQEQADRVFSAVMAETVEPAVTKKLPGCTQFEFDAAGSGAYNLGNGMLDWQWAKLWRAGSVRAAWDYFGTHYNTAGGKQLKGLVRRRKEEANLALHGDYGFAAVASAQSPEGVARGEVVTPPSTPDPVVKEAQELLTENGFNPGAIDGWMGKKTKEALIAYQKAHPHLVNDGILGPATLAQLRRDATAVKDVVTETLKKGGSASALSTVGAFVTGIPVEYIVAGVVCIVVAVGGYYLWKNRDLFQRRENTRKGVTVDV